MGTGGANASIRFDKEMAHGGNAGLPLALKLLEPIKKQYPDLGYADLFQMASATAIEVCGGPDIDMKYGRVDAADDSATPVDGRLPSAGPPFQVRAPVDVMMHPSATAMKMLPLLTRCPVIAQC